MTIAAHCVWPAAACLGEGPVWSARERAVWFVDIKQKRIHCLVPASGQQQSWDAPAEPGFLAPVRGGGFIAGLKSGLHRFDPASGSFTLLTTVEPPHLENRLNDGFVDARGRLWFGSMHDPETANSGALYRMTPAGKCERADEGYCVTNGPAVSPDGKTLYHVDTSSQIIYAFDLGPDGSLTNKRVFARIQEPGVYPDGPIVDAQGFIWTGLFGGWGLVRYSPQGEMVERIEIPCANVTKAAFGDDDLRTLYITTAWVGLSESDRQTQPLAGGLFSMRVPVPGLPQNEVALTVDR
jgi:sugar lactone lactonase YvrE